MTLETRYHFAIEDIGIEGLLNLPESVANVLDKPMNLEAKTEMLEAIAEALNHGKRSKKKPHPRTIRICPYCMEEFKSRGEKVTVKGHDYEECTCEWCDDETDEIYDIVFK